MRESKDREALLVEACFIFFLRIGALFILLMVMVVFVRMGRTYNRTRCSYRMPDLGLVSVCHIQRVMDYSGGLSHDELIKLLAFLGLRRVGHKQAKSWSSVPGKPRPPTAAGMCVNMAVEEKQQQQTLPSIVFFFSFLMSNQISCST